MTESPGNNDADRLMFAGLLGLSAASVIQLSDQGRDTLTLGQELCTHAFAVSIPLLAVGIIIDYARRAGSKVPGGYNLIGLLGAVAAVFGLGSMFYHLGVVPCALFAATSVVGMVLVRRLD